MISTEQLQNLVAIRKLKTAPPDAREFNGLLLAAKRLLPDAELEQLSPHSRFQLAYDAARSLALAALRWHGYRASDRYIVFQTLPHTLNFPQGKWRLLDNCHQKRNVRIVRRCISGRRAADPRIDRRYQRPSRRGRKIAADILHFLAEPFARKCAFTRGGVI